MPPVEANYMIKMTFFTILIFSCLISALITYGLGIFVFSKNPTSVVHRLFFATMLTATYWALCEFLFWNATSVGGAVFWLKAASFWVLIAVFSVHFILEFCRHPFIKHPGYRALMISVYTIAILFALMEIFTETIYVVSYLPGTGYFYLPAYGSMIFAAEAAFVLVVMIWVVYISLSSWLGTSEGKTKRQSRLVSYGLAMVILFGFLSGVILPAYMIYTPNLVFIGIVLFSVFITYAIIRYGLFTLSPETAVPDIIRTMPDGLVLADKEGRIITTNASAAEIFGVKESEITGRPVEAFFPSSAYASIISATVEQETLSDLEVVLDQKDNKVVSISCSVVKSPDKKPAGFVLIVRDITARKASEKALRSANEKITLLNQVTRHDISNLVTALSGYLSLIVMDRSGSASAAYINSCVKIVEKIRSHIQFSRDYQDIGQHEPFWQSLGEIIAHAESDLPHEGIEIATRLAPVEIYVDPLAVKVFYNLLENAVRHGQHVSRIQVSGAEQSLGELVVTFEDNGIGVEDGEKEQIFRSGYGKNTGLGLAISREVLSVTGIRIAETGTMGTGARFEIRIPAGAWRPIQT